MSSHEPRGYALSEVRVCTKCQLPKDIEKFRLCPDGKRGSWCRECLTQKMRDWRASHPEEDRAKKAQWRNAHPAHNRANRAKYRARIRGNGPAESFLDIEIFERDGWICQLCMNVIDPDLSWPHPKSKSVDHILAILNGGVHTRANVQAAHLGCNASKGASLSV